MRGIVPALGVLFALAFAGARAEERPPIHAEEGSVAIGGNVSNSTIGVPYEKLEEAVRSRTKDLKDLSDAEKETNALLKEKLDLNQRQVKSALEIVGEANVPPERLGAKLVEIAERFKDLQTAAAAQPGDDSKITALKAEAQKAIQDGQLGEADEILAAIEKIQTEALDRLALNAAQTTAQRGDVALTRLRYPDAAQRFAEAAAKVPQGHEDDRWKYLNEEADALYRQGDEFGDNAAAALAIERYRHLAELWPRNAFPLDWAMTQMNLGNALRTLGERESGTARLEEAVAAYREALQENTRARVPLEWAKTQGSIGTALARLGSRESGTARLEEAVAAFREALQEFTRARAARLGRDPEQSRHCAPNARLAGERDGAAGGGRRRLSRSPAGIYPRARAAPMGHDPDESRQCAPNARLAGERDGAAGGGRRRASRSLAGKYPRARAAPMGHDPDESRQCARNARRAGERNGKTPGGRRGLSRSLAGKYPRAHAARLGQEHRQPGRGPHVARRKARRCGDGEAGGAADRGGFHGIARRRRCAFGRLL
jgi:tetratricopeptide (TPR) repeat protein